MEIDVISKLEEDKDGFFFLTEQKDIIVAVSKESGYAQLPFGVLGPYCRCELTKKKYIAIGFKVGPDDFGCAVGVLSPSIRIKDATVFLEKINQTLSGFPQKTVSVKKNFLSRLLTGITNFFKKTTDTAKDH